MKDLNITEVLRESLPVDSFLFNPSIAHVKDDTYLVSVRSYKHLPDEPFDDNPILRQNRHHPWGTSWDGHDVTYILPMTINEQTIDPIDKQIITIPVQDARLFRFMRDGDHIVYIVTFNEMYAGHDDVIIKGGDTCDDFCYLIGWGYLLVDVNDLKMTYLPGEKPLCTNISHPVEKNWSIWRYDLDEKIYLMVSYGLTPSFSTFSANLRGIRDGEVVASSDCKMETERNNMYNNIFAKLEKYYDNKLYVSLSTPAYQIDEDYYQAVGHLKIRINYLRTVKSGSMAKYAKSLLKGKKHLNPTFVYLMFVYRFQVDNVNTFGVDFERSGMIELTGSGNRLFCSIKEITPAFSIKTGEYDYFLNFPSGMVIDDDKTLISYGDGDATAHILSIDNKELNEMFVDIDKVSANSFKFLHGVKDEYGRIKF